MEPKDWEIHSALGIAHDFLGDPGKAQERYDTALSLSPQNPSVLNNVALSRALAGDLAGGIAILEQQATRATSSPQIRQNLALLYALKGDLKNVERLTRHDLPEELVQNNLAYLRNLDPKNIDLTDQITSIPLRSPPPPEARTVPDHPAAGANRAEPDKAPPAVKDTAEPAAIPAPSVKPEITEDTAKSDPIPSAEPIESEENFVIQIAAYRSAENAQEHWQRLKDAHADLLGELEEIVERTDRGSEGGVYYRLRAGPLASEKSAKDLCRELSARDIDCLVVRP